MFPKLGPGGKFRHEQKTVGHCRTERAKQGRRDTQCKDELATGYYGPLVTQ